MRSIKRYILIPILIFALGAAFSLGFYIGQTSRPSIEEVAGLSNKTFGQPAEVDFGLFWDAWAVIQKKYVNRRNLDPQKMIYGAITGLVKSLEDPYSVFMEPTESKQFIDDMGGSFGGIGAEVGIRKDILTVIAPLEDSPAKRVGLLAGDKILKIDETLTADLNLDEAVRLIRGPIGKEVVLLVSREGWEQTKEIKIIRETIKIPILKWEMKEGYLATAVDIASWFLAKGEIVALEDFGNGEKTEYRSQGYEALKELPTVILLNQGSASASEIVAGDVSDQLGIKIVGEKSFGKGSVQELEKLKGGSSLKITIAKWLTPNGTSIQDSGLEPDIIIEMTKEDMDENSDPQMEKAIELLIMDITL